MIQSGKRQRTFKLSVSTETQIAHLCQATGSGATAVVEQAVATRYRELFGKRALLRFVNSAPAPKVTACPAPDDADAGKILSISL